MTIKQVINVQNQTYQVDIPDACPICHRHSQLVLNAADVIDSGEGVQIILRCGYSGCKQFFFCYYGSRGQSELLQIRPIRPVTSSFSQAVSKISPMFISVFNEAEEASQLGLKQIAGPGYRKAFEFLIKDYAKTLAPGKEAEIEKKFAGAVVTEFVGDPRIQAVAKRSLWLGNDETHYLRKWTEHDVTDLVTLIKLAANWIEIDHLSKDYVEKMPEG